MYTARRIFSRYLLSKWLLALAVVERYNFPSGRNSFRFGGRRRGGRSENGFDNFIPPRHWTCKGHDKGEREWKGEHWRSNWMPTLFPHNPKEWRVAHICFIILYYSAIPRGRNSPLFSTAAQVDQKLWRPGRRWMSAVTYNGDNQLWAGDNDDGSFATASGEIAAVVEGESRFSRRIITSVDDHRVI